MRTHSCRGLGLFVLGCLLAAAVYLGWHGRADALYPVAGEPLPAAPEGVEVPDADDVT